MTSFRAEAPPAGSEKLRAIDGRTFSPLPLQRLCPFLPPPDRPRMPAVLRSPAAEESCKCPERPILARASSRLACVLEEAHQLSKRPDPHRVSARASVESV